MIQLNLRQGEEHIQEMLTAFESIGLNEAIFMSHYQLAETCTDFNAMQWKEFLLHPMVSEFIMSELALFTKHQQMDVIRHSRHNSVGAAQMINSLEKINMRQQDHGPEKYIYSYVPLNTQEQHAPDVQILDMDIFAITP